LGNTEQLHASRDVFKDGAKVTTFSRSRVTPEESQKNQDPVGLGQIESQAKLLGHRTSLVGLCIFCFLYLQVLEQQFLDIK